MYFDPFCFVHGALSSTLAFTRCDYMGAHGIMYAMYRDYANKPCRVSFAAFLASGG